MIPERLKRAAEEALKVADRVTIEPAHGDPGEIGLAGRVRTDQSPTRIVAVVQRDEPTKTVMIQLATNEIEQATDLDLILQTDGNGTPFALAVQAELYGPLFTDQLQGIIGHLDPAQLKAISHALATDGESLQSFVTGPPLASHNDPRRQFKEQELEDLDRLVSECRAWLSDKSAADAILDPLLLVPPPTGTPAEIAEDQFLELLDAVDAIGNGPIVLPTEFLEVSDFLLDELLRWREDFGFDASRVLVRIRIIETEEQMTPVMPSQSDVFGVDDSQSVLAAYLTARASRGTATIDIHSAARCWGTRPPLVVVASGARFCRGRARLPKAA